MPVRSCARLHRLSAVWIYRSSFSRHNPMIVQARTSICATYMRCIHDEFHTARDMLLMSHLQVCHKMHKFV